MIERLYLVGMGAMTGLLTAAACGHLALWLGVGVVIGLVWGEAQPEESQTFFSEEKKQKTFIDSILPNALPMAWIYSWAPEAKVFCFFSSEKKAFLLGIAAHGRPRRA